jgi:hypothetical protein
MEIAKEHQNMLKDLKKMVEVSYEYFHKNAERFNEFMRFVFETSLTNVDITKLQAVQKPQIEFNVLEAIINNRRGEFSLQEPSIVVHASDGVPLEVFTPEYIQMIDVLESYVRETISGSSNGGFGNKIMKDLLAGGYSVAEIYTDYINEMSMDQQIIVKRVFDPTLTFFDPLARETHKGDGAYCGQLYPITRESFIEEFGKQPAEEMKFSRGLSGFNWSYNNTNQDIILMCDLWMKKRKKTKIVKISSGHVVTKKHYEELLEEWNQREFIEQAPIILEERTTFLEDIVRYRFCETKVFEHVKTNYKYLPLVFFDGNSADIKDADNGAACQMTRPYVYQAKGIQKLKNFAGQTVAAEIENMVQHKFIVPIEAIPDKYEEAYRNVQQADVLMYNSFNKGDVNVPLAPPREIQRTPTPPLVETTFLGSDNVTQAILGNYDSTLGTNKQDVSGVAIANGAIHTSAAATPYLQGYIDGLNRIAQIELDLIPKYYVTPRTLPVRTPEGKRTYQVINTNNHPGSIEINYRPNELNVKIEAGVNNALAKQAALDQIIKMMGSSPLFAQFINTMGLETILDNMDIRGIDSLKAKALQFMEQMQQAQQQAAQQPNPEQEMLQAAMQIEQMKVQQKSEEAEAKLAVETARIAIEKEKVNAQIMEILNDIEVKNAKVMIDQEKVDSENSRAAVQTAMEITEAIHKRNEDQKEL